MFSHEVLIQVGFAVALVGFVLAGVAAMVGASRQVSDARRSERLRGNVGAWTTAGESPQVLEYLACETPCERDERERFAAATIRDQFPSQIHALRERIYSRRPAWIYATRD